MVVERTAMHYPNLQSCRVVLSGTPSSSAGGGRSGGAGSPVPMPREALDALAPLPPPYSFETERDVISKKGEEESKMSDLLGPSPSAAPTPSSSSSGSYGNLTRKERDSLTKMKNVTNASDSVCLRILRKNRFKVDTSVNAYYRGDR
mmetsp:Transcript_36159/g.78659  ORF Transcript_36159/g.78659 Transcript_36159/m.78659 type:complete len:147 (+) Transcript_36159:52-492(+)